MSFEREKDFATVWLARAIIVALLIVFWSSVLSCAGVIGCAAATVEPDGTVRGMALAGGHVERCVPRGEAGLVTSAPSECVRIEAQSLPSALLGLFGQAASALAGLVF